ncbi:MAG TPA: FHA domain-containing protein, partial [Solirubrobacteraceae bacterium]|nr:FHA domain-containing protein [Solirubrobacteraceae bacterium]
MKSAERAAPAEADALLARRFIFISSCSSVLGVLMGGKTQGNGRLELRVTVSDGEASRDLSITASAAHTVERVAERVAELLERDGDGLWCERRGEHLDATSPLAQSGIRWGDRLLLSTAVGTPKRVGGSARVELVVTGGPCAGRTFELGDGRYRLGRDPEVDICLPDPSLSRHHLDLRVEASGVSIADVGSSNGTAVKGEALLSHRFRALDEGDELELGRTLLRVRPLRGAGEHEVAQRDGRLDFNRPPRVNPTVAPFNKKLPAPPSRARKARLPLAASLVPLVAGVLLFLLLKSPAMLAIAGLSPAMAISTYLSDRRGGKKSFTQGSADFRANLESAVAELDSAVADEIVTRRVESPDAPSLLSRVSDLAPDLWERSPDDSDFLCLRVGVADLSARSSVRIEDGGDPELRAWATERLSGRDTVASVPLTVDVGKAGVVGLAGSRPGVAGMARWLVLQSTILHSPGELVLMAALTPMAAEEWSWLKWLPHLRPDRVGLQSPPVAIGRRQAEDLLAEIRDLVAQRGARAPARSGTRHTQLLLLIDEETEVDRALLSAALSDAGDHGVAIIWIGRDPRNLPGRTGAIVEIEQTRAVLRLTDVSTGAVTEDASAEAMPLELADRTARQLAPIRDISELARASDIPRRVGLLDLLGLLPPTPDALKARWADWRGGLRATVGVGADGVLTLDLPNEGPHALIAGTTGSGKSELLRTLVAAAAASAPPHRLSF